MNANPIQKPVLSVSCGRRPVRWAGTSGKGAAALPALAVLAVFGLAQAAGGESGAGLAGGRPPAPADRPSYNITAFVLSHGREHPGHPALEQMMDVRSLS